jgi:predicted transcriptional regulator
LENTLQGLTAEIVSAYVTNHKVENPADIIRSVYAALSTLGETTAAPAAQAPAVDPKKSVFKDHIVCLEDGMSFSMLKRHLRTEHGMTPEEYRAKWRLPHDYPMVAPDYSTLRSGLAKTSGLGVKRAAAAKRKRA